MFVGIRKWNVVGQSSTADSYTITISTESYEAVIGEGNRIGMWWQGENAQLQVWSAYLHNMNKAYSSQFSKYKLLDNSNFKGSVKDEGYNRIPWGPADQPIGMPNSETMDLPPFIPIT